MSKCRDGFRVIGENTTDGGVHCWYFPTLEFANAFAKQLCADTGKEVDVCQYIGSWKRSDPPTEFIKATSTGNEGK